MSRFKAAACGRSRHKQSSYLRPGPETPERCLGELFSSPQLAKLIMVSETETQTSGSWEICVL